MIHLSWAVYNYFCSGIVIALVVDNLLVVHEKVVAPLWDQNYNYYFDSLYLSPFGSIILFKVCGTHSFFLLSIVTRWLKQEKYLMQSSLRYFLSVDFLLHLLLMKNYLPLNYLLLDYLVL